MQRLLALPKPYLFVFGAAFVAAVALGWPIGVAIVAPGLDPNLADKDFANYWLASRLLLSGKVQDLFAPWSVYFGHLRETFGSGYPWHNWSYPPHFLFLIWPLGLFGYETALLLFLTTTGVAFLIAYRAFIGERSLVAWVAAMPFMALNFWAAQNGYLCAALALGALALREKRPIVAGILLGLLTIKPQLGLLFPFLLVAERRWSVIACGIMTALLLVMASTAVFGLESWRGYIQNVVPYQNAVMGQLRGLFLAMMPSVYGALRNWDFGPALALMLHLTVALPAALVVIMAFFRVKDARHRDILLLVGTFIITPYALTYDLGLLAGALGLMVSRNPSSPESGARLSIITFAMLLPLAMIHFGLLKIPLATAVLFALFFVALRDAGLTLDLLRRGSIKMDAVS
ncbi:glycosyltransferase family 87 protein [Mesorhizobium argentiipisi]|uniref:Glycosyltransferase family 87 protein n=1 Tax=Mesorhizobium argentiipisi TaxID=3015175 RepID=A0ABU8KC35_9HYPH